MKKLDTLTSKLKEAFGKPPSKVTMDEVYTLHNGDFVLMLDEYRRLRKKESSRYSRTRKSKKEADKV